MLAATKRGDRLRSVDIAIGANRDDVDIRIFRDAAEIGMPVGDAKTFAHQA